MARKKAKLTHIDEHGAARMVDVGAKEESQRLAIAEGSIRMQRETLDAIRQNAVEKGDVLTIANIAGINAA